MIVLILTCVLGGCASSYRPIRPSTLNYTAPVFGNGIGLSYKYDVLKERRNKKYAAKEADHGLKLIAVKLTNNTDTVINVGRDLIFTQEKIQ